MIGPVTQHAYETIGLSTQEAHASLPVEYDLIAFENIRKMVTQFKSACPEHDTADWGKAYYDFFGGRLHCESQPVEEDTPKPAGFKKMAEGLYGDLRDWTKSGFKMVEDKVYAKRIKLCGDCEHIKKPSFRCDLCGCFMKAKAKMSTTGCPAKKW